MLNKVAPEDVARLVAALGEQQSRRAGLIEQPEISAFHPKASPTATSATRSGHQRGPVKLGNPDPAVVTTPA